jgi:hypothetical protein
MVRRTICRESNDNKPWRIEGMFVDEKTKEKIEFYYSQFSMILSFYHFDVDQS